MILEPFNNFCVIFMYWAEKTSWTPADKYTSVVYVGFLQVPVLVGKVVFVEGNNVNKGSSSRFENYQNMDLDYMNRCVTP